MTRAWIIEATNEADQVSYWTGSGWVGDGFYAMRFARKCDAERARDERRRQDKTDVMLWQMNMAPMMPDGVRIAEREFDVWDKIVAVRETRVVAFRSETHGVVVTAWRGRR